MSLPNYCYMTVTSKGYNIGTRVLMESVAEHNPDEPYPWIVLTLDDSANLCPYISKRATVIPVDMSVYDCLPDDGRRLTAAYSKLRIYGDYGFDRHIFLDSDALCLRHLGRFHEPCEAPLLVTPDAGRHMGIGYHGILKLNIGIMVAGQPYLNDETHDHLVEVGKRGPFWNKIDAYSDQGIFQHWIAEEKIPHEVLPIEYNFNVRTAAWPDWNFWFNRARVFHYLGDVKPWHPPEGWMRRAKSGEFYQVWLDAAKRYGIEIEK